MVIKCLEQIRKKSLLLSSLNPIEVPYARLFFDVSEPRVPERSGTLISLNFPKKSNFARRVSNTNFRSRRVIVFNGAKMIAIKALASSWSQKLL